MLILVTNDDGIGSPGLVKLQAALSSVGEVLVIAPERDWTGAGHSKSIQKTLRVSEVTMSDGSPAYATDGTPTDCVALAALGLVGRRPDIVVSGINKGPNLGHDVTYSGTVAAAMEATISDIPALAFSLGSYDSWPFDFAADFAARLVRAVVARPIERGIFLNVNIPALPDHLIRGVEITRLGQRIYRDALMCFKDKEGRYCYHLGGDVPDGLREDGTDIKAVADGLVSITPIHLDLTHHGIIPHLQNSGLNDDLQKILRIEP